jgi:hypothetical protein
MLFAFSHFFQWEKVPAMANEETPAIAVNLEAARKTIEDCNHAMRHMLTNSDSRTASTSLVERNPPSFVRSA